MAVAHSSEKGVKVKARFELRDDVGTLTDHPPGGAIAGTLITPAGVGAPLAGFTNPDVGVYEVDLIPPGIGVHHVRVEATDGAGDVIAAAEVGIRVLRSEAP